MTYRLAIVGSRDFDDRALFYREMQKLVNRFGKPRLVVSGGARGADTFGEQWAKGRGIEVMILLPDWAAHGRAAGNLRNTDIVAAVDRVIAFHKDGSRGTLDTLRKARRALGDDHVHVIDSL